MSWSQWISCLPFTLNRQGDTFCVKDSFILKGFRWEIRLQFSMNFMEKSIFIVFCVNLSAFETVEGKKMEEEKIGEGKKVFWERKKERKKERRRKRKILVDEKKERKKEGKKERKKE